MQRSFRIPDHEEQLPPHMYHHFRFYVNAVTEEQFAAIVTPILESNLWVTYVVMGTDSLNTAVFKNYMGVVSFRTATRVNNHGRVRGVQQLFPEADWAPSVHTGRDIDNVLSCRDSQATGSIPIER